MNLRRGEIVRSLKGHDTGKCCYVMNIDGDFLYLADGKHRRVAEPKKKRAKHVKSEGFWTHPVTDRISKGEPVLDSEIRRALAAFRDNRFSETKEV